MDSPTSEVPKIKRLDLTDDEMDYVAVCVIMATATMMQKMDCAAIYLMTLNRIAIKIGPENVLALLTKFDKIT